MADPRQITVSENDLPLHCPPPGTALWDSHPRVFLDVTKTGEVLCPYCGTRFQFSGKKPKGH